ncbi:MAG: sulfite exporter TauE/SafE family protein [Proteobacteria bacterium]|nr:sulfite exporter TauE/SafE family protein [Pseudomonadota bacterium]
MQVLANQISTVVVSLASEATGLGRFYSVEVGECFVDFSLISIGILAAALVTISIGAFAKGITGVGLPVLAVPALASFTSVEEAVVLMVLPGIASNSWLVFTHRKWTILREHRVFLLFGLVGAGLGTWLLSFLNDHWLKVILAIWLGVYLLQYFSKRSYDHLMRGRGGSGSLLGMAAGIVQGACGVSAPIVAPYFHANGLIRETYAFATAFTFLLLSGAQILTMSNLALLTPDRLSIGLVAVVPTLLFTQLGIRWSRKIDDKAFNNILLTLFIAIEFKLLFDVAFSLKG